MESMTFTRPRTIEMEFPIMDADAILNYLRTQSEKEGKGSDAHMIYGIFRNCYEADGFYSWCPSVVDPEKVALSERNFAANREQDRQLEKMLEEAEPVADGMKPITYAQAEQRGVADDEFIHFTPPTIVFNEDKSQFRVITPEGYKPDIWFPSDILEAVPDVEPSETDNPS